MKLTLFRIFCLPVLLVLNLSCDEKKGNTGLGPSTTAIDIQFAQDKSLAKLDPYNAQAGQKVHKVETQEIVTSQGLVKSLSKESTTELTQVENLEDARLLTTLKNVIDYTDDEPFVYKVKNVFALPQINTLIQNNLKEKIANELGIKPAAINRKVAASEIEGVSFHNLSQKEVVLVPPQRVLESENCGGLSPCEIPSDMITYDVVFHLDDGTKQTHQLEWFISSSVPFFAGILKQCATTLVPLDDLRVLVKQCNEVVDFNP